VTEVDLYAPATRSPHYHAAAARVQVLEYLMRHADQVVTRTMLLE